MRWNRLAVLGIVLVALAMLAACNGGDDGAVSTPTTEPTPTTTATDTATPATTATTSPTSTSEASLEAEVAEAYLAYWDAYSAALLELDISLVEGHAAGEELDRIREEIEMLRADGVALRVVVEHDFSVARSASAAGVVVVDRFLDRSFYVDPITKEPESADVPGERLTDSFDLEQTDDGWVVVRSRRLG